MTLVSALQSRERDIDLVSNELNALVPALITRFNSEVTPRLLSRLPTEPLPGTPRQASSFRARVSLLIEYSFVEMLADFLNDESDALNVTFNTTNQFSDFFIRNENWQVNLRIDVKTLHDRSAEASARFSEPVAYIREFDDYLLYVSWQWRTVDHRGIDVIAPAVIDAVFIPAVEVAQERDLRQTLSGGMFSEAGDALAASGIADTNFGKINRLIYHTRRDSPDLSPRLRKLLQMMEPDVTDATA